jgi:hypothetical protein
MGEGGAGPSERQPERDGAQSVRERISRPALLHLGRFSRLNAENAVNPPRQPVTTKR